MQGKDMRLAGPLIAGLLPLIVYLATLAREITFIDSGELAAAAATLGIAHPPGYPLFTLLGHLLSWLPAGTVAFRVGLLSAGAGALAALLIHCTGRMIMTAAFPRAGGAVRELAPLAGALLFAFARTPWSQAVVIEVYALQTFLVMAFLALCTRAWRDPPRSRRYWPGIALLLGLALANHLTSALLGPALVIFLGGSLRAYRRSGLSGWPWAWVAGTLIAGLLPLLLYLYLPLRARLDPAVAWDYPQTLHRFLVHVTARQYHGGFAADGLQLDELQRFLGRQLPQEATWILVILAVIGLAVMLRRTRMLAWVTLAVVAPIVVYNMGYAIHDIQLYYQVPLAVCGLWAAVGAGALSAAVARRHRRAAIVVAAACSLACLLPLGLNWRANDQRDSRLVEHFVKDVLRGTAPGAVIFSSRWDSFCSPALYYQRVTGYRPDVTVLDLRSLAVPGLYRRLSAQAPALADSCRGEMEAVAEIAYLAERRESYDVALGRARLRRLQRKLVEHALALKPTYATSDMIGHPMLEGFHVIAEGLAARLSRVDDYRPFPQIEYADPGITPAGLRNDRERGIYTEYARMLIARARYLQHHGLEREAQRLGRRGQALLP